MTKNDNRFDRTRLQDEFPAVPEGFHRRMAQTLDGLEEKPVKKKLHLSAMLIAAVILTLATGAVAATYRTGWVDIDGNFTPDEPVPESTHYEPETEEYSAVSLEPPAGEYWEVQEKDEGSYGAFEGHKVATADELAALLDGSDLPMLIIPEGMTAECISVTTDKESTPYESIELEDDRMLNKYHLRPLRPYNITSYNLILCDETGKREICAVASLYTSLYTSLDKNMPEVKFSASEQDMFETLDVPGYDKAIYLRWTNTESVDPSHQNHLSLMRELENGWITFDIYDNGEDNTSDTLLSLVPPVE